jgi:hypothetical protein
MGGPGINLAPKRNEYQKIFLVVEGWPARKADTLTDICEPIV